VVDVDEAEESKFKLVKSSGDQIRVSAVAQLTHSLLLIGDRTRSSSALPRVWRGGRARGGERGEKEGGNLAMVAAQAFCVSAAAAGREKERK
jgi:hypothetical protein